MKNVLKAFTVTVICTVILISNAPAQAGIGSSSANAAIGSSTFYAENVTGEEKGNNVLTGINPRAVKDFQKSFKDITNAEWSRIDDGYIAAFTMGSVQTRVDYNRNGSWLHTIRYYEEKKLPREVRDMVKSVYYDYAILNVIEVNFGDQPVYMVYLQDETHLKAIRVYDGEMKEVQNYVRG
jgi:hypothetical protein